MSNIEVILTTITIILLFVFPVIWMLLRFNIFRSFSLNSLVKSLFVALILQVALGGLAALILFSGIISYEPDIIRDIIYMVCSYYLIIGIFFYLPVFGLCYLGLITYWILTHHKNVNQQK